MVSSKAFQDYWDNLPQINSYEDSVGLHEAPFTQRFERLGFTSDVYVNTEDLEGFTLQPILFAPKQLIAERRCPHLQAPLLLPQLRGRASPGRG